jgi:hypothetical protein
VNTTIDVNRINFNKPGIYLINYTIYLQFTYNAGNDSGGGDLTIKSGIGMTNDGFQYGSTTDETYISFGNLPYPIISYTCMIQTNSSCNEINKCIGYINCSYTTNNKIKNIAATSTCRTLNIYNYPLYNIRFDIYGNAGNYAYNMKQIWNIDNNEKNIYNDTTNLGKIQLTNPGLYIIYYEIQLKFNTDDSSNGDGYFYFTHGIGENSNEYNYYSKNNYLHIFSGNYPSIQNTQIFEIKQSSTIYINCNYKTIKGNINKDALYASINNNAFYLSKL